MKISIWATGKAHDQQISKVIEDFSKRVRFYFPLEWKIFPSKKISNQIQLIEAESQAILKHLTPDDYAISLDEHGRQLTSPGLAALIENQKINGAKNLVFIIGGAYGLHDSVLKKSKFIWSLSELTFPHQLVRLILTEQIYRACTIIRKEKYHHS